VRYPDYPLRLAKVERGYVGKTGLPPIHSVIIFALAAMEAQLADDLAKGDAAIWRKR